jgi:hypothetical protein
MAVALPLEPQWREPALKVKRILMINFVATQARAKGAAPYTNREGGQTEAATTKTPSALPSPTVDGWIG